MLRVCKCHFHAELRRRESRNPDMSAWLLQRPSIVHSKDSGPWYQVCTTPENHSAPEKPQNPFSPKPPRLIKVSCQLCPRVQSRTQSLFPFHSALSELTHLRAGLASEKASVRSDLLVLCSPSRASRWAWLLCSPSRAAR